MKRFMSKKVAVVGLAVALVIGIGGAAFAYFTSTGTGTGSAVVGTSSNLIIQQLGTPIYNSTVSPLPGNLVSQSFEATGTNELGNQIAVTSTSAPLSTVVVTMDSWACENYLAINAAVAAKIAVPNCASTPGTTYGVPITFNIFKVGANNALGSLIATDTQTFQIPFRPSANTTNCPLTANDDNNGEWYNNAATATTYGVTADSAFHNGLASNITFDFSSQGIVLPSKVIYGIAYSTGSNPNGQNGAAGSPISSLNVGLTTEPPQPTVGSDPLTGTGSDYINITNANGGGYYANYCDNGVGGENTGFRYDAGPCTGHSAINYPPSTTNYIPAVQFNASGIGVLYPGGASQPINFSVTNPGGGDEYINSVTITASSVSNQTIGGLCDLTWFPITGPTAPVGVDLVPGTTYYYGDASVKMVESSGDQDPCQGVTVNLKFAST